MLKHTLEKKDEEQLKRKKTMMHGNTKKQQFYLQLL